MYIKTKKVELKDGSIQKYYYVAMSLRVNDTVYPEIIKYLGKEVPPGVREWLQEKNKWLRKRREEKRRSKLTPLMKRYEEETGKYAVWHGQVTKQFTRWKRRR